MLESSNPGDGATARELLVAQGVVDPSFTVEAILTRFTELCQAAHNDMAAQEGGSL